MLKKLMIIASITILSLNTYANAKLLKGYVQQEVPSVDNTKQVQSFPLEESFPNNYVGSWNCVTTVTSSALDNISLGQKTISFLQFFKNDKGKVKVNWNEKDWTQSQCQITSFNNKEVQVERTNYYWGENNQGQWASRSKDVYNQVNDNYIVANSEIDQYYQGQFVGRYKTESVLIRATQQTANSNVNSSIAMSK